MAVGAVLVGTQTDPSKVTGKVDVKHLKVGRVEPALDAKGWINSPPLTQADLRGKVVLYDFWTFSCINCRRTLPYIRAWYDHYRSDGLVVIGVHSPEFDFEKVHANVAGAVKRDHVTWPVALDDDMTIWNAFGNNVWPADYIADRTGHQRYTHLGEGDYANTENVIRELLGVSPTSPRAGKVTGAESASTQLANPETYLGLQQANPQLIQIQAGAHDYPPLAPGSIAAPRLAAGGAITLDPGTTVGALVGRWTADEESVTADAPAATIVIAVHAQAVNLVMATATGKPIDAVVELDGQPVPAAERGADVHVDGNGRTVVTVRASDMYRLLSTPTVTDHVLRISAAASGLQAYDFTFG